MTSDGKLVQITVVGTSRRLLSRSSSLSLAGTGGFGHRAAAECLEHGVVESVETAAVGLEFGPRRERDLGDRRIEILPECGAVLQWPRVDVDDAGQPAGHPVARRVGHRSRTAVRDEHNPLRRRCVRDDVRDCGDVIVQSDAGAVAVRGVKPGQGHRGDVVSSPDQVGSHCLPRPCAEPESGSQDDVSACAVV